MLGLFVSEIDGRVACLIDFFALFALFVFVCFAVAWLFLIGYCCFVMVVLLMSFILPANLIVFVCLNICWFVDCGRVGAGFGGVCLFRLLFGLVGDLFVG